MDEKAIESFRNDAITATARPGRSAKRTARMHTPHGIRVEDDYGAFPGESEPHGPRRPERTLTRLQMMAFDTLHLSHSATLIEIKARYKELVKRYHPDANGGDRAPKSV